jgi:hypothetical protein
MGSIGMCQDLTQGTSAVPKEYEKNKYSKSGYLRSEGRISSKKHSANAMTKPAVIYLLPNDTFQNS